MHNFDVYVSAKVVRMYQSGTRLHCIAVCRKACCLLEFNPHTPNAMLKFMMLKSSVY